MRLTEGLHFYFGDRIDPRKKVHYTHFEPSQKDYEIKKALSKRKVPLKQEIPDLFA